MNPADFVRRVIPDGGTYCVEWRTTKLNKAGKPIFDNAGFRGMEALSERVTNLVAGGNDVYLGMASFKLGETGNSFREVTRQDNNVRSARTLFADLDVVSPAKPKADYPTHQAAIQAVAKWCRDSKIPYPNIWVNSGNGLHVHWVLDTHIDLPSWALLSRALTNSGMKHGIRADWGASAQPHQLMRVPGTLNFKDKNNPRPVQVLASTPGDVPLAAMKAGLADYIAREEAANNSALKRFSDARQWEGMRYSAAQAAKACRVFEHIAQTGGAGTAEPLWYTMMQSLAHCHDGADHVHPWSEKHPTYTHAGAEEKWERVLRERDEGRHPPTCRTVAEKGGSAFCAVCPHNGRAGIALPIQLGQDDSDLPDDYKRVANGVDRRTGWENEQPVYSLAVPARVKDVRVIETRHADAPEKTDVALAFDVWSGQTDGWKYLELPLDMLTFGQSSLASLSGVLTRYNVNTAKQAVLQSSKEAFVDWLTNLRGQGRVKRETKYESFGWVMLDGKRAGFAAGPHVYLRGKQSGQIIIEPNDEFRQHYVPRGDLTAWQEHVRLLRQNNGSIDLHIAVATSFAAPLADLAQARGLVLNLCSPESGSGKTTSLESAQAVWAHPIDAMSTVDDTENAVAHHMGKLRHLPKFWDEVRSRDDGSRLAQMIFRVAQGRERARLTANAEAKATGSWATMLVIGSNVPLEDVMEEHTGENLAGRNRVFSLQVPPLPAGTPLPQWPNLKLNYGVAGAAYARWLVDNVETVEKVMDVLRAKVIERLGVSPDERFWRETIVTLMAGVFGAKAAGVFAFDAKAIWDRLIDAVETMRRGRTVEHGSAQAGSEAAAEDRLQRALRDFLTSPDHHILRVADGHVATPPQRMRIVGQLDSKAKDLTVSTRALGQFATNHRLGRRYVMEAAEKMFGAAVPRSVGARTAYAQPRELCLVIDLTRPEAAPFADMLPMPPIAPAP